MSTKIELWTQQSKKVKELLFDQQRLTAKKDILSKNMVQKLKYF
ncbi:hypothetical protein [Halanaerobium congolense]|jgi:hypothetical protein|uniref:Uncharacterized protein n=1 Tax=Halanaerobium congolense TaxID=54121 RepID=A0A1G6JV97_9FIRM|nr:hypothetical protein [Halanaerobium congolense]PXV65181.1 hypothetical protein C8C78_11556 [Halanaerobium congolense]TDP09426.1 hypothetical protein C8C79_1392 [Halanaerobium congolense]TDS31048.1 hypothetical protein BY453_1132 [Halanaerobium congolense]TDX46634.1 hypothetical protein C7954_1042 [Halanaerobium congolense]SDC22325.1 hypothetical protein SAMN04488597_103131 [Halanaerobium congolense]